MSRDETLCVILLAGQVGSLYLLSASLSLDHFLYNKIPLKNSIDCSYAKDKLWWCVFISTWTKVEGFKAELTGAQRGGIGSKQVSKKKGSWGPKDSAISHPH